MIAPFTLGRTPPPPGPQATREAASALTPPLLDRVFPPDQETPCCGEAFIDGGTAGLAAHINHHLRRTA